MKSHFKIICRNSKLSLIQGQIAQRFVEKISPIAAVEIISKAARGDLDLATPLYLMSDKNIFTQDIEDELWAGNADFAVHSMKDINADKLSDPRFCLAIIERNDPHDVLIFNSNIHEKLKSGAPIRLGTSSLRREELIPPFLKKALPRLSDKPIDIKTLSIRGNVDTRLRKLISGNYDCIALAAAGLNRLLVFEPEVREIFSPKEIPQQAGLKGSNLLKMLMPMTEVPPAAGQGALLIECLSDNTDAVAVIAQINDQNLMANTLKERAITQHYGAGCHQRFGVVCFDWQENLISIVKGKVGGRQVDSFTSEKPFEPTETEEPILKISSRHTEGVISDEKTDRIWTADTQTWYALAQKGTWVMGCADGFGWAFLTSAFESPLFADY